MRYGVIVVIALLCGCSTVSPPKPPSVKGEYKPVNINVAKAKAPGQVFDFDYEGDILGSLPALRAVQPQLEVLPPEGETQPVGVRLHLRHATIEEVLTSIGAQSEGRATVVWNSIRAEWGQVFIRFKVAPSAGRG